MRNLSAIFEHEADARAARERLVAEVGLPASRVSVMDRSRPAPVGAAAPAKASGGLWAHLKELVALPSEGRPTFEQALTRGGWLLTASVPDERVVQVLGIVERSGIADLGGPTHERDAPPVPSGAAVGAPQVRAAPALGGSVPSQPTDASMTPPATATSAAAAVTTTAEQRIPVVEERLHVGTRDVERGAVHVHTHASERPVHERVVLRDYRVRIERRMAERPLADAPRATLDDLFRERTIELTETKEEALIGKRAHVREELVIRREMHEHVEEISDSVRRTEVEVERVPATGSALRAGEPPLASR